MAGAKAAEWNYFIKHSRYQSRTKSDDGQSTRFRIAPTHRSPFTQLLPGSGIETVGIHLVDREGAIQLLSFLKKLPLLRRLMVTGSAVDHVLAALTGEITSDEANSPGESRILASLEALVIRDYSGSGETIEELIRLLTVRMSSRSRKSSSSRLLINCEYCEGLGHSIRRLVLDYNKS
jgi:hypothetical protein